MKYAATSDGHNGLASLCSLSLWIHVFYSIFLKYRSRDGRTRWPDVVMTYRQKLAPFLLPIPFFRRPRFFLSIPNFLDPSASRVRRSRFIYDCIPRAYSVMGSPGYAFTNGNLSRPPIDEHRSIFDNLRSVYDHRRGLFWKTCRDNNDTDRTRSSSVPVLLYRFLAERTLCSLDTYAGIFKEVFIINSWSYNTGEGTWAVHYGPDSTPAGYILRRKCSVCARC